MLNEIENNSLTSAFPSSTCSYQWTGNAGTHFWHAHTGLQKVDGLYGSVIVRQPPSRDPNSHLYDFDLTTHIMLLSDWLHEDAAERYPGRLAVNTGQDPESMLINGKGQFRDPNTGFMTNTPLEIFTITPGKRYRFRMINAFASVCPAQVTIEGHSLTVISTDGEPVHPVQVNTIISFSGKSFKFIEVLIINLRNQRKNLRPYNCPCIILCAEKKSVTRCVRSASRI
jgi:L-ascorbate oxidase